MVTTSHYHWSKMYSLSESNKKIKLEKWLLLGSETVLLAEMFEIPPSNTYSESIATGMREYSQLVNVNNRGFYYKLIDKTNCFNINTLKEYLISDEGGNVYSWEVFKNLLSESSIVTPEFNDVIEKIRYYFKLKLSEGVNDQENSNPMFILKKDHLFEVLIDTISDIDKDFFLQIAPLLCIRNDNSLLININMLETGHSKLVQAMFMNIINEKDIIKTIRSKPDNGWDSVPTFLDCMLNNAVIEISDVRKVKEIVMSRFSLDEYFISSVLWLKNKDAYYQLTTYFHIKQKKVTVLRRRYEINDKYNE
ncbi:type II secretion system protein GspK [Yersinia pekkanenii]|nr:type II secretion system protein GspK [Yersinia pekkanenii]